MNRATTKEEKYIPKDAIEVNHQLLKHKGELAKLAKAGDIKAMRKALGQHYIELLQKFQKVDKNKALNKAYSKMIIRQKAVQKDLGKLQPGVKADQKKASQLACELIIFKAGLLNKFVAKQKN